MKLVACDKRRLKRAEAQQVIRVIDEFRDIEVGRIVNLHEEGFMIIGAGDVSENCIYQLTLILSTPVDSQGTIRAGAECLWVKETSDDDRIWAGFHIMDISEKDVEVINRLQDCIDK